CLQLYLLSHAHRWGRRHAEAVRCFRHRGGHHAAVGRSPALECLHDDCGPGVGPGSASLLLQFLLEPFCGKEGRVESVASERARVAASFPARPWKLLSGPSGLPRSLRVQLAAGDRGLPAAIKKAGGSRTRGGSAASAPPTLNLLRLKPKWACAAGRLLCN